LTGNVPSLSNLHLSTLNISNNSFAFGGMETLPNASEKVYAPQDTIPISRSISSLSVSAGGTLANDTFCLYKNGILNKIQAGDSVFVITDLGEYYITITNALAPKLTLFSDIATYSAYTIANGNWNDPLIWAGGIVPSSTAPVIIRNTVTVTTNVTCYSLKVEPPSGNIIVATGINLTITH
jgi:hypothetical protein